MMILCFYANEQNQYVVCELWPSKISTQYAPFAFSHVAGSKSCLSHAELSS